VRLTGDNLFQNNLQIFQLIESTDSANKDGFWLKQTTNSNRATGYRSLSRLFAFL